MFLSHFDFNMKIAIEENKIGYKAFSEFGGVKTIDGRNSESF